MSKAVLVMDMPESCFGCNFLYCNADAGIDSCQAMKVSRIVDSETYEKPDWCPLRELPEKANHPAYCDNGRFDKGWNACLDEILSKSKGVRGLLASVKELFTPRKKWNQ